MKQKFLFFCVHLLSHASIYSSDKATLPARPFYHPTERLKLLLTLDYCINRRTKILSLLRQKADPNVTESGVPSGSLLYKAVQRRDCEVVKKTLACGADPNVIDETGASLLMHAECPRITQYLLDAKANPAFVNADGENPLHEAVNKPFELMALLCNAQVDPNKKDTILGNTPLHRLFSRSILVSDFGKKAAALLLAGADPTIQNVRGDIPLAQAMIGHITVANTMIQACPAVKKEREERYNTITTCLHAHFPRTIAQLALTYVGPQTMWDDAYWPLFEKHMSDIPVLIKNSINT